MLICLKESRIFRSRFIFSSVCLNTKKMVSRDKLRKVADADREAEYGYVFGVSGPGMRKALTTFSINDVFALF